MQKHFERALIFIGFIYYVFVFPHGIHGDGYARYATLENFILKGEWSDVKYPMLGTILSTPLYYLGHLVKTSNWWMSRYNTFLFLGMLFAIYRLLRKHIQPPTLRRFILLLMAGSMFSKHVTDYYGEVFTATTVAIGFILIAKQRDFSGIFLLALGITNTPVTIVSLGLATTVHAFVTKRMRFLLAPIVAAAFILLENYLRRGLFFHFGYDMNDMPMTKTIQPYTGMPGFTYPIFFGLISIFFSFGKGLIFYMSGIFSLLNSYRVNSKLLNSSLRLWLVFSLGLILTYAKWSWWFGGWYWGPRFFLFISIPAAFSLAVFLEKPRKNLAESSGLLVLLLLSVWVSTTGVSFGQNNMEPCVGEMEYVCLYVPEFSELWRPFVAERGLGGKQTAFIIYHLLVLFCLLNVFIRDFWQGLQRLFSQFFRNNFNSSEWRF